MTTLNAERSDVAHRWPSFLPDGNRFLFFVVNTTSMTAGEHGGMYMGSLESDETQMILRGESRALYSEGHLLYRMDSTLMAQPVDLGSMELRGDAAPISADVAGGGISWGGAHFGVSPNGVLANLRGDDATFSRLVWRDRAGEELGFVGEDSGYAEFDLSNDGQHLAVVDGSHTSDVWLFDLDRGVRTRFTFDSADDRSPIFSPDDDRIAFASSRQTIGEIYVRPVSGNEPPTLLHSSGANIALGDWSPDGRWILYESLSLGENTWDIMAYDIVEGVQVPVVTGPFVQQFPALSPDGRWLAFVSGESGRQEVYVKPFPEGPGRWMVSTEGGTRPMWKGDGSELVFFDAEGYDLYAVEITGEHTPSFGAPEPLFVSTIRTGTGTLSEMTADGERFVFCERPLVDRADQSANLIQNWTRILER